MTDDGDIDAAARALPRVFMTEQWGGSHVYKLGDADRFKMFAILIPGRNRLTVKTADSDTADFLIEAGVAERNVHLPRGGWVALRTDRLDPEDVAERLATSHSLAAAGFPGSVRRKFGLD
ncbi:MAG: MmcQ/YjbR family DNA-binding protein [Litorimonas sp.]